MCMVPQQGWPAALQEVHVHQGCEEQWGHVLPAHELGHWGRGTLGGCNPTPHGRRSKGQCPMLPSAPSPYFKGDTDQKMSSPNTSCCTDENAALQPT